MNAGRQHTQRKHQREGTRGDTRHRVRSPRSLESVRHLSGERKLRGALASVTIVASPTAFLGKFAPKSKRPREPHGVEEPLETMLRVLEHTLARGYARSRSEVPRVARRPRYSAASSSRVSSAFVFQTSRPRDQNSTRPGIRLCSEPGTHRSALVAPSRFRCPTTPSPRRTSNGLSSTS